MVHFKSCPRCHGDMYEGSDFEDTFRKCLQCGHLSHVLARSFKPVSALTAPRQSRAKTLTKIG